MLVQSKINAYSGMRFYKTNDGLDITENVKLGKTKVFEEEDREEAEVYAREKRSYIFPIDCQVSKDKEEKYKTRYAKKKHFGYGVPS